MGAVAYFILGALWFTPLFGKQYDVATGVVRAKGNKWPALYYYGPFIGGLVTAIATAVLFYALNVESLGDAVILGAVVGIGYSAAASFTNAIAPNMPKPVLFAAIVGSYHVAGAILVSIILSIFS